MVPGNMAIQGARALAAMLLALLPRNVSVSARDGSRVHLGLACNIKRPQGRCVNSLRPSDPYMRQQTIYHWFR